MYKLIFAAAVAITMTATASAHIWNRPAQSQAFGQRGLHTSPCPISYAFKRGFCVKAVTSKTDWFKNAVDHIL